MSDDSQIRSVLAQPGTLTFPANLPFAKDLAQAGGAAVRQPSGHLVFYGPDRRRVLATDPDGTPLHECEWSRPSGGAARLLRARLRLDWGRWVGIVPGGLVNATQLDLSKKPGWQRLRADDLRRMAAQAMQVPFEEVRFFYGDEDLVIDARGQATIRHKKDAFYVLDDGTFERARFMACMGAMRWAAIDFLPVVELFQSLLPGTGSATFELIRGLYDDQQAARPAPLPLRYRGIPTYPSEAAYRLFQAFFTPQGPSGQDPFPVFMDVARSHEVLWLPAPAPPRRYFDGRVKVCVTIAGDTLLKATKWDDPTGLPYMRPVPGRPAPCGRQVSVNVAQQRMTLQDGARAETVPLNPSWGVLREDAGAPAQFVPGADWRSVFGGTAPAVEPAQAFSAVLIYPDDETEIGEWETQPFVADYLQDLIEQVPELGTRVQRADTVLVAGFDAAATTCLSLDRPRNSLVRYRHPAFAQKQAQMLWTHLAQGGHLDWLARYRFVPEGGASNAVPPASQDVVYWWTPFGDEGRPDPAGETCRQVGDALRPGGLAFLAGTDGLQPHLRAAGLTLLQQMPVEHLPTVAMHRSILPKARVKVGLTLFLIRR